MRSYSSPHSVWYLYRDEPTVDHIDFDAAGPGRHWRRHWLSYVVLPRPNFHCAARTQGTAGGNEPADCNWPLCGCDPSADKVVEALIESGAL
jgi:hypothetical protein